MKKTILALALAAGLTSFAGTAKAGITYNWSFNGNSIYPGSVAGVLTLNDAGTQATSAYVTSSTSSYNSLYNLVDTQNNYVISNSFTVHNGQIVFANFNSYGMEDSNSFYLDVVGVFNAYVNGASIVANNDGLNGVTFTPLTSGGDPAAVPEPSQVAASLLLAAGVAGFVIVKRRQEASELEALAA